MVKIVGYNGMCSTLEKQKLLWKYRGKAHKSTCVWGGRRVIRESFLEEVIGNSPKEQVEVKVLNMWKGEDMPGKGNGSVRAWREGIQCGNVQFGRREVFA